MVTLAPRSCADARACCAAHRLWKRSRRISATVGLAIFALTGRAAAIDPGTANPFELASASSSAGRIDELVFARLQQAGLEHAPRCSDAVFVRRAFIDVIGTLPTAAETRQFLQDPRPQKRAALIDRLLARDEFADYWTMKWSDLLRVKAEFPVNLWPNAAQAYHRWIHTAVRDNLPYDQFARELLTANGSNFSAGQVNFFRAVQNKEPQTIARAVALTFMGTRAERWPANRLAALSAFFAQIGYKSTGEWKEEIVFFDPNKGAAAATAPAIFPDGTVATLTPGVDPRSVFADWLTSPQNPWFARAAANRVWSWLLGCGIVHEPDDLRPDNPPVNPELLAYLEQRFIAAHFDMKQLMREILNSTTYQLSSIPRGDQAAAEANFACYTVRRLDAEVLIDAINQITGTTEKYSSSIPEPFTFVPEDQRSIALPDGSITSSFLEMFGRPPRDTGLEAERNNRITDSQRLYLLNSTQVQRKLEQGPKIQALLRAKRTGGGEIVDDLYLTILSRRPTGEERRTAAAYMETAGRDRRAAAVDLAWALINSAEFLHRH